MQPKASIAIARSYCSVRIKHVNVHWFILINVEHTSHILFQLFKPETSEAFIVL